MISLLLFLSGSSHAEDEDKLIHFGGSALVGGAANKVLYWAAPNLHPAVRVIAGGVIGSIPGYYKEQYLDGRFDGGDFAADVVGAFVGSMLMELTNGRISFTGNKGVVGAQFNTSW